MKNLINRLGRLAFNLIKGKEKWEINIHADSYRDTEDFNIKEFAEEWKIFRNNLAWFSYTYWKFKPFFGKYISINSFGNRSTQNLNATGKIRIVMLGGSTVWGMGVQDSKTIPSLLSKFLNAKGVFSEVINLGQIGYNTTQDIITFTEYIKTNPWPDYVVVYSGINDLLAGIENNGPVPYQENNRINEFNILKSKRRLIKALFNLIFSLKRVANNHSYDELLIGSLVNNYKYNLELIESLKEKYEYTPIYYLHPTIFHKRKLTQYESEQKNLLNYAQPYIEDFYNKILNGSEILKLKNFTDLSGIIYDLSSPCFVDHAHLSEDGNSIIANKICSDLINIMNSTVSPTN